MTAVCFAPFHVCYSSLSWNKASLTVCICSELLCQFAVAEMNTLPIIYIPIPVLLFPKQRQRGLSAVSHLLSFCSKETKEGKRQLIVPNCSGKSNLRPESNTLDGKGTLKCVICPPVAFWTLRKTVKYWHKAWEGTAKLENYFKAIILMNIWYSERCSFKIKLCLNKKKNSQFLFTRRAAKAEILLADRMFPSIS